jgi:ribonuclease III
VVTEELMRRHPEAAEGDLAWMRQAVVGREPCAAAARRGDLMARMAELAPSGEEAAAIQMAAQTSVQAALAESVIGAGWLDLGPDRTTQAVLQAFAPALGAAEPGRRDAKTTLQELAARDQRRVRYRLDAEEGPPHSRTFRTSVLLDGRIAGSGAGASKQASEQAAAAVALQTLGSDD